MKNGYANPEREVVYKKENPASLNAGSLLSRKFWYV